jgi:hypothetical protein
MQEVNFDVQLGNVYSFVSFELVVAELATLSLSRVYSIFGGARRRRT